MGFQSLGRTRSDKPHGTDESDGHSSVEGLPGDDADSECADICELPDADDIVWLCESLELDKVAWPTREGRLAHESLNQSNLEFLNLESASMVTSSSLRRARSGDSTDFMRLAEAWDAQQYRQQRVLEMVDAFSQVYVLCSMLHVFVQFAFCRDTSRGQSSLILFILYIGCSDFG